MTGLGPEADFWTALAAGALLIALMVGLVLLTCQVIPDWFERRRLAKLEPAARGRAQRYNQLRDWPREQYNAILDLQDEVAELKAQLREREPRLGTPRSFP
jgi:hypothetical protein